MKIPSLILCLSASSQAVVLLSEFEPNPAGGDPAETTVEISGGIAGASFDYWLVSIENDGYAGTIDRSANVTGTFDLNGLAVVMVPDLENPSFTFALIESTVPFTTGTDLDPLDDGNITLPADWTAVDAVGISDNAGDDATLYGELIGGSNILFNGEFEPLNVFRSESENEWYQTVTADFNGPTQRIAVFTADGTTEVNPSSFTGGDPTATTFGTANPAAVPEPSSALLGGLAILGLLRRRR